MSEPTRVPTVVPTLYWLPKPGHRREEYEDAAAGPVANGRDWYAAIADGATESAFAKAWAVALVEAFVKQRKVEDTLTTARRRWQQVVARKAAALPWYVQQKLEDGAHAAFLGLALRSDGTFTATVAGDCCLFHFRDNEILSSWPFTDPADFHHHPRLLGTHPEAAPPDLRTIYGTARPGDTLALATDATARWLLANGPARALTFTPDRFAHEMNRHPDDKTLLLVEIGLEE